MRLATSATRFKPIEKDMAMYRPLERAVAAPLPPVKSKLAPGITTWAAHSVAQSTDGSIVARVAGL
ncbi:hypothetical protein SAMN07250955_107104 [Arboricoccus pini]|uniref:Uncharacterized protein n=1 Tax=Arboricoccus pini TaxID=1963835 RepID=A0A212RD92_9PROT|nr:hypothetical protein SAMN07250955_107104 [Arboricoccus pini]